MPPTRSTRSTATSPKARAGVAAFKRAFALKDEYRDQYRRQPEKLLAQNGYLFPPATLRIFADLYHDRVTRACVCAPRGGGKTNISAGLAFSKWYFQDWNCAIVAGSKEQALRGIEYISDLCGVPQVSDYVEDETRTLITGRKGNWIKACPASTKAIRGIHARGRSMLLVIDEEAEVDPAVLRAALNTVRDAKVSIILRLSTYHKVIGSFAELVDDHERLGYALYRFDSFDVCTKCTAECGACFSAYRSVRSDWPALSSEFNDLYCQGRAHQGQGWLQVPEIRQARIEQNREWFETENMGWKPSGEGLVLPPDKVKAAFAAERIDPTPGSERWFGIDWGFKGMTAVNLLERVGEDVNHLASREFSLTTLPLIIQEMKALGEEFGERRDSGRLSFAPVTEVYPDVSHPFENGMLAEEGFDVTPVPFVSFKETGAGWLRYLFERGLFHSQKRFDKVERQLLGWRRNESGQIVKKDDHHCDSLLAATMKLQHATGCQARAGSTDLPEDGAAIFDLLEEEPELVGATYD